MSKITWEFNLNDEYDSEDYEILKQGKNANLCLIALSNYFYKLRKDDDHGYEKLTEDQMELLDKICDSFNNALDEYNIILNY